MLDMDLVEGRPTLQVEFRVSLVKDLTEALSMVMNAPWIEGLDQWVYATHAALPAGLRSDMEAVLLLLQKCQGFSLQVCELAVDHPAHRNFAAVIDWLNGFSVEAIAEMVRNTFDCFAEYHDEKCDEGEVPPSLDDPASLQAFFTKHLGEARVDQAMELVENPAELKALFISVVTRFWEQFYRAEYELCSAQMERSAAYHQHQNYSGDFATVFEAVAGRRLPKEKMDFDDVEQVVFVPSGHVGPYVMLTHDTALIPGKIFVHYNCRPTGAPERGAAPPIGNIFPPLKALADETRLQILSLLDGRELYAQEIVDELDISQSAVSRHLKLMLTGGLLNVRKQDSMKYFSINQETLAALANRLTGFSSKKD